MGKVIKFTPIEDTNRLERTQTPIYVMSYDEFGNEKIFCFANGEGVYEIRKNDKYILASLLIYYDIRRYVMYEYK